MRKINAKEFAARVDDRIADELYNMLVRLMYDFERQGFVRELSPFAENHIEVDIEEAAEQLKEAVYERLVELGLDVTSDGRDF